MRTRRYSQLALIVPLAALFLAACPKSPEERVAKLRSYYTARAMGIIVDAVPEPTVAVGEAEAAAEMETPTPAGEAAVALEDPDQDMVAEVEPVPVRQTVRVDILLQHDSPEKLPGITLDIEMVDSNQALKHSWKVWVDTSKLPKATGTQFTHTLEDLDYVDGDGFNVEVRSYVPPEERGEYREFAEAGG